MTLREKIEAKNAFLFVLPWLIGFGLFVAFPIGAALWYSLCHYSVLSPAEYIGGENYLEVLTTPVALRAIARTFAFAIIALPASFCVSLSLALLLERRARGVPIFRTLFFLPALVPQVAIAALLLWLFASDGLINRAITEVGLPAAPWLRRSMILPTLLLMALWPIGHAIVIFTAGLQDVPRELYESAEIDGAGYLQRVRQISIPMISPVILFNMVMGIIAALGQFTIPYFIGSGNTQQEIGDAANFVATEIKTQAMDNLRMGYASALSWILLVAVIVLTAFVLRFSRRVVHYRGE
jgi:multiple sugar transport system permease protein